MQNNEMARPSTLGFERVLSGRRVLVTGHSGFKGGWLTLWLHRMGATVHGLSLAPATSPNLMSAAGIEALCTSKFIDIRDAAAVADAVGEAQPEVIFHLAAQPLVSRGFEAPIETFSTNMLGTAHVLEAARNTSSVRAVVCVTTDKVYADNDWYWGYREDDRLGGKDPYSASKAAAEMVTDCYRATLAARGNGVAIATARGGNTVGGGDWSDNRVVPDFVRALTSGAPLTLRNPEAVRPWQHALSLVHGYLVLAARLLEDPSVATSAWNFGPVREDATTVRELVEALAAAWRRPDIRYAEGTFPETRFLHLDSARARAVLNWRTPLGFADVARLTAEWYRDYEAAPANARLLCERQINEYRVALGAAV
jgi:CDP-glucose 4,6-dehydratase